jgi:DNA invertase Pin-like site-specific DNA recombinase
MKLYVAYYRVSTGKPNQKRKRYQGIDGLGMEAQQAAVLRHVNGHGSLVASYKEVESGKRKDRPELAKAIAHAKQVGAILVIAKLDRLARNVAFTSALMESGVEFVCCDMPDADKRTIHIIAAIAEGEAKAISDRTKAALAAYKAKGGLLGSQNAKWQEEAPKDTSTRFQRAGSSANHAKAANAYTDLLPVMREWRGFGLSLAAVADRLNQMGQTTRGGRPWNAVQVKRVLDRVAQPA